MRPPLTEAKLPFLRKRDTMWSASSRATEPRPLRSKDQYDDPVFQCCRCLRTPRRDRAPVGQRSMREDGWLFRPIQVLVPFPLSERDGIVLDLLLGFAGCARCPLSDVTPVAYNGTAHSCLA